MCVSLWDSTEAVGGAKSRPRPQRRPKKPKLDPIVVTPPAQNIDIQRVRKRRKRQSYRSYTVLYLCLTLWLSLHYLKHCTCHPVFLIGAFKSDSRTR